MDTKHEETILEELKKAGITDESVKVLEKLHGTTEIPIFLIQDANGKMVVKTGSEAKIAQTSQFLKTYSNISLFPTLRYVGNDHTFIVYDFVEGKSGKRGATVEEVSFIIDNVINKYKATAEKYWGSVDEKTDSLPLLVKSWISCENEFLEEVLGKEEISHVHQKIDSLFSGSNINPYIVHGDLGAHNLIIDDENKLVSIIDPDVQMGIPVLELLFLVFSKPPKYDISKIENLFERLSDKSNFAKSDILDLCKISILRRIVICKEHHPSDLPEYLNLYKGIA